MNIGIKFKIPNKHGNFLKQILNKIDSDNFIWKLEDEEEEIYINGTENLFELERYTNNDFKKLISKESYYTIFADIKLYENEDNIVIDKYEDFLKSSCILILLITDNIFVEIYSKEEKFLKTIYDNAFRNGFSDINYITEDNFKRKKFSSYSD